MKKLKVGIVGCGTIGSEIALYCHDSLEDRVELTAICDIDKKKEGDLASRLNKKVKILALDAVIGEADIVIESASAKISADIAEKCIAKGKDCLIMSVGGLLGKEGLLDSARSKGVKIYIPSGAVCGIDGLKAASIGEIESVTLITRKPPKGLIGAPYLVANNIDISKIGEERVVFEGSAEEAIKGFPQNVNVAAVLSLAGIGAKKTRVRIITSPEYRTNTHEIEITGDSGRITTRTENMPSKANPKTSALAVMAAIATLEGITDSVKIGT